MRLNGMKLKLKPLHEQVVVLIGASSGIGRQAALDFAARGAKIVAVARDEQGLHSLAELIGDAGGEIVTAIADTASYDQLREVASLAVDRFSTLR